MNMCWKAVTSLLQVPGNGERGRPLLNNMHLYSHNSHSRRTWRILGHPVRSLFHESRHRVALIYKTTGGLQRAHPNRPLSAHPYRRHEHSRSPAPSSSSSGFPQPHAYDHRQGIAPQPMRYSFTHPGGWPDRLQRSRIRGSIGSTTRARTSHPSSNLGTTMHQERAGKRKRRASAESSTAVPQTVPQPVAAHRDSVGPQRSHRRHHNVAEKTQSTVLPSGGMFMTFPLDIPSPEPESEGGAPAGPPPFEHGPSELPPRPYEPRRSEGEGSGTERTVKRGRLPADVMDHVSALVIRGYTF